MRRTRARSRRPGERVAASHVPLPTPYSETLSRPTSQSLALSRARGVTPSQIATVQSWQRAYGNHAVQRHLQQVANRALFP